MGNLKIDVDKVISCANNIRNLNSQIGDGFPDVQNKISSLDSVWEGAAATSAISKFNAIKSSFCDARYNVVDNYVNYLLQQVGEGYTQTESVNKSLADAFK